MRLRVWGHTNGEYGSLTLKCKTYAIKLLDDALKA